MQSPSQPRTHRREKEKTCAVVHNEKIINPWTLTSLYYGMLI